MSLAKIIIIAGLVIGYGGFIFDAINMWRAENVFGNLNKRFMKGHIVAMVIMVLGVFLFLVGLIIGGTLNRIVR